MVKGDQSDNVREEGSGKVHYTKAEMVQMVEAQVKRLLIKITQLVTVIMNV